MMDELAVCDMDGVLAVDFRVGLAAGKALVNVLGDLGGTFGGTSSSFGVANFEGSAEGIGPFLYASGGGSGGVLVGMTSGARSMGRSMEDARLCDRSFHSGVVNGSML